MDPDQRLSAEEALNHPWIADKTNSFLSAHSCTAALDNMRRRKSKMNILPAALNLERISMSVLQELLTDGLDFSNSQMKKTNSISYNNMGGFLSTSLVKTNQRAKKCNSDVLTINTGTK